MNEVPILKKIVTIASYVDNGSNEKALADYICQFLTKNIPWLKITKQPIDKSRYNILAMANKNPDLIFICHMDTVKPTRNNMLKPKIVDNKLYGLGAVDMKGGIAALLSALSEIKSNKKIGLIFDCDEEYNFKGIKEILKKYSLKPRLVICPEPTNLQIVNGCRGIIELSYYVNGKSAHAGQPNLGINAIEKSVELVNQLKKTITLKDNPILGTSTVNLSGLQGGINSNSTIKYQANAVPNIAYNLIDIRLANNQKAADIIIQINKISKELNISLSNVKVNLDYRSYFNSKKQLTFVSKVIKRIIKKNIFRENLGKGGFYEAAFVSNQWTCPAISFGPGNADTAHTINENVDLKSVVLTKKIFKQLIENIG